jgi:hypothetical protein
MTVILNCGCELEACAAPQTLSVLGLHPKGFVFNQCGLKPEIQYFLKVPYGGFILILFFEKGSPI